MSIFNSKPKGIKRKGAPKKDAGERKAYIHISISQNTLKALDALAGDNGNRSELIEKAIKSHYLIG